MKKLLAMALVLAMSTSLFVGCGAKEEASTEKPAVEESAAGEVTEESAADEAVTITLGIWPEDTLTDDIAVHEGYVATMKELHPNVTCEPAYYKYATDTFMPMF